MSLEQYTGFDQSEGGSEGALEALKERMAAAAVQIAAIKKEEGKQKQKEEELLKFLLKFVKTSSKKELVLLLSRVLEQNIPANFIIAAIILTNPEIHEEIGHFNLLRAGDSQVRLDVDNQASSGSHSLVFFDPKDETLPLKIKIELDTWIKNLLFQAEENPQKLLRTAYDIEMRELPKEWDFEETQYEKIEIIKSVLIQLITLVMREFLKQHELNEPYEKLYDFAKFIITGILSKTRESLEGRKLLS